MTSTLPLLVTLTQPAGLDAVDVFYGFLTGALGAILFGGEGLRRVLADELPNWPHILEDRYGKDFADQFGPLVARRARISDWLIFLTMTCLVLWGYFGYRYYQFQNDKESAFGMGLVASLGCISLYLLPWIERKVLLGLKFDICSELIHLRTWS